MKKEEERKMKNKGNNINNQKEDVKHSDVIEIVIYNYLLFNYIYNYLLFNCNI